MTDFFRTSCSATLRELHILSQQEVTTIQQQKRRKQCQQLKNAISNYARSNTWQATVPELLRLASILHSEGEYSLALRPCCQTCLDVLAACNTSQAALANSDVLRAQTEICAAKNAAASLAEEDAELNLADSVSRLVGILSNLQAAMQSMLSSEQNHWMVYEGACVVKDISSAFRRMPGKEMLQILAFTVLAMETDLTFSLPEHLPLRIDLYLVLVQCQTVAGLQAEAFATVQKGLAAVAAIEQLEKLEPLPPSPEAQAAYDQARTRLNTAKFALDAVTLPSEQAIKDALQAMFTNDSDRLAAVAASLLPVAPNRIVKHQPCPAALAKLLTFAEAISNEPLAQLRLLCDQTGTAPQALPGVKAAETHLSLCTHRVGTPCLFKFRRHCLCQLATPAQRASRFQH